MNNQFSTDHLNEVVMVSFVLLSFPPIKVEHNKPQKY